MHICLVCNEYPPAIHGGIGSTNYDLAEGLTKDGHDVTVVGVYPRSEIGRVAKLETKAIHNKGGGRLRVVRLPENDSLRPIRLRCLWNRWRLKAWLAQGQHHFDILEFPDYEGWLPWGGPRNLPSLVRVQGTNVAYDRELDLGDDPLTYWFEVKTLKSADYTLGCSRFALAQIRALCGPPRGPSGVSYTAVDTDFFAPNPEIAVEQGLIVFVNSIGPRKGVSELMEAANLLVPRYPAAHFVLIGGNAGQERNGLSYTEQMKAKLRPEVASHVVFAGRLDRYDGVRPYLQKAQVCCYPSHSETLGLAPIEAMACGKPTIYSTLGAGPEVIEHGVSGLLCNPKDPADIAAKLLQVLNDRDFAGRLGATARQRVLERFSRSKWISSNVAFYEQCIREFSGNARKGRRRCKCCHAE